jgi:hypothetical protein
MDNGDLGKYHGMLPSRAVLARLSIFGTSEETRASANAILKALPPMNEKERRAYLDETWILASLPSEEDLLKSPIGKATLELLKNSQPLPGAPQVSDKPVEATDAPVTNASSPAIEPDDGVNPHLRQLHWPPKPTAQPPKPVNDEPPRDNLRPRYVAGRPSTPDTSQRPLPPDESFSNNDPLY